MRSKLLILTLATAGSVFAQGALDLQSRAELRRNQLGFTTGVNAIDGQLKVRRAAAKNVESTGYGFISLNEGASTDAIEALGVEILSQRGNILVVAFPYAAIDEIAQAEGVRSFQLSREVNTKLDRARAVSGIDKIHQGLELPQAYTGKGIVCGIVDTGMDPNHINFKDSEGNPRIKQLAFRRSSDSGNMLNSIYTSDQLEKFETDASSTYHGAHTMGIMAGSYKGDVNYYYATGEDGKTEKGSIANPYYGAAYESDIVASCGTLQDAFIAYGISGILDYAYEHGQPAVINLSLGSNTGPHDGNGMLSQYITAESNSQTEGHGIFCISSGNEGDLPIALNKTLTAEDSVLQTFIKPNYYTAEEGNVRYGTINVYSEDSTVFDLQAVIYNKSRGRVALRIPMKGNMEGSATYYVSDASTYGDGVESAQFSKAFDGYVGVGSMIDNETGRFYAIIDYMTTDNQSTNADGNYILGLIVSRTDGKRVDIFCDGAYTELDDYDQAGWSKGSLNGTISDLATTKNAVIVGSYNTRDSWISLDGNAYGYDGMFAQTGSMSEFTSFGTIIDGRNLPTVCAPGATIISSTNTHYVFGTDGMTNAYLQAQYKKGSTFNYWQQMVGSSMASPLVAGSIALWLEADPTLTASDVLDIIAKTSTVDNDVLTTGDPIQWGAGKFDAYAGLKEVLRRSSGVDNVAAEQGKPLLTATGDNSFNVFMGGAKSLNIRIFDMSGRLVANTTAHGDEHHIDLSTLTAGVYAVSVNGSANTRVLVK